MVKVEEQVPAVLETIATPVPVMAAAATVVEEPKKAAQAELTSKSAPTIEKLALAEAPVSTTLIQETQKVSEVVAEDEPLLEGVKMPEFMEVVCVMIPFLTVLTGMAVGIYYAALDEEAKLERRQQYSHKKVDDEEEGLEFEETQEQESMQKLPVKSTKELIQDEIEFEPYYSD